MMENNLTKNLISALVNQFVVTAIPFFVIDDVSLMSS